MENCKWSHAMHLLHCMKRSMTVMTVHDGIYVEIRIVKYLSADNMSTIRDERKENERGGRAVILEKKFQKLKKNASGTAAWTSFKNASEGGNCFYRK